MAVSFLRLIDVQRQCIVKAPRKCRYMALSYVWGGTQELQLTRKSHMEFERPNGLSMGDKRLPRTIADAMLLVSRFDERYLWADSLCIIQDDAENKHDQIALMDVIYQEAILTIVAVSGKKCRCRLARCEVRISQCAIIHRAYSRLSSCKFSYNALLEHRSVYMECTSMDLPGGETIQACPISCR